MSLEEVWDRVLQIPAAKKTLEEKFVVGPEDLRDFVEEQLQTPQQQASEALLAEYSIPKVLGAKLVKLLRPSESNPIAQTDGLSPNALENIDRSCFIVIGKKVSAPGSIAKDGGVGCGVFFAPGRAITAKHVLPDDTAIGSVVTVHMAKVGSAAPIVKNLWVYALGASEVEESAADYAILHISEETPFIPPLQGDLQYMRTQKLYICSFQLALDKELPEIMLGGLVFDSTILKSSNDFFITYSCSTFAGDSGAAVVNRDGQLMAMHLMGINDVLPPTQWTKGLANNKARLEEFMESTSVSHVSSAHSTGHVQLGLRLDVCLA